MSLIKHSALNLAGNFIPALVTLPAYGYLARALGVESFGIYTLAIIVIGYSGIFDAGLTRAVIREISLYRDDKAEQKKIIACGTISIVLLGTIAMLIMVACAASIVDLLNVSLGKKSEAISAISVLALSIPIFLLNQIWLSILEGNESFLQLNIQRSVGSFFIAGIPVLLVFFEKGILPAIIGLFIARLIMLIISAFLLKEDIISAGLKFDAVVFKRLISFGGWSAIVGIIGPVMIYFDRFILAGTIGANKVAFYSAPSDLVSRGLLIPGALSRALFPKIVFEQNTKTKEKLKRQAYNLTTLVCGFGALIIFFLASDIMVLWMGSDFDGEPVLVLKILLIGFFFNSLAHIPFAEIQANGNAKLTALIHLLEVIPYLLLLFYLVEKYGVVGAAIAWSVRYTIDFFILFILNKIK